MQTKRSSMIKAQSLIRNLKNRSEPVRVKTLKIIDGSVKITRILSDPDNVFLNEVHMYGKPSTFKLVYF